MSTSEELIRRAAAQVKTNSNNAKAAALLIQAANLLSAQPSKALFNMNANRATKDEKRGRFAAAMFAGKEADKKKALDDAHNDLTADGWVATARNPATGSGAYQHKSLPGHELKTDTDGTFSISKGAEQVVPKTNLKSLKPTLKKIKPM